MARFTALPMSRTLGRYEVQAVHDAVNAVRDRRVGLTKDDPPPLRGVGQQTSSIDALGLKALRDDAAHAPGETSDLPAGPDM